MAHISEYEVEDKFISRLESIGYEYVELKNYGDVVENFRTQLAKFNKDKLVEAKGAAELSDDEFSRVMIHVDNHSVYESAKIMRDKFVLTLDNGKSVYLEFFSYDTDKNIYQVTHQVTMDKDHKEDVAYKNRYDVTVLINGLPMIQIELKRPGIEINEAINQINRYRKFSFKGLFRYLQLFVVSNSVQTKYFCNENEMDNGMYNPILKSLVFFWTDDKNTRINTLEDFTAEFFRKAAITEMIQKYMVIKTTEPVLMVMRPYQIYAVKAAKKRILEANQNGFVFACTGSGKTLTSFKLAQLLREEANIDKVVFLIDRKDLDDQTVDEYNSFEKDCVDSSDSTYVLVKQLQESDRKMIVTTIQKMAKAVTTPRYEQLMDSCAAFNCKYDAVTGEANVMYGERPDLKMQFVTAHKSKGLQADYVFIINNKDKGMGFPSKIQDDPVVDLLLEGKESFPYAEERRLFYVALTRAKVKSFMVVVDNNRSVFATEMENRYEQQLRQADFTCPVCGGRLERKSGPYGDFYGCSNYSISGCKFKRKINKKV